MVVIKVSTMLGVPKMDWSPMIRQFLHKPTNKFFSNFFLSIDWQDIIEQCTMDSPDIKNL